ncbi:MAG: hypothetical protein KAS61_01845 [Spirochaetes bacterium]|nr:hypothetical protein [Spirochaetota bacterium]
MNARDRTDGSDAHLGRFKNRSTVIAAVFTALILVGVALRALSGNEIVLTTLIYSPSEKVRYPGSRTPEDTVKSFYLSIDNGDYERAYSLILEPRWTEEPASYREAVVVEENIFRGWTEEEEFLRRLKYEIGIKGSGITLNSINAHMVEELEADTYFNAFDIAGLRSTFGVEVHGNILGACSIFSWRKELTVLQIGRRYRVLLDGTKEADSFYYQSWFTGFEKIGDIRGGS